MTDKKTEIPGLYRSDSGALISKDLKALTAYKQRKANQKKVKDYEMRLNNLEERVRLLEENANSK